MRGAIVVPVAAMRAAAPGDAWHCCACGRRYAVKRTVLQLRDGALLYGTICPDCILQGPNGAARRMEDRFCLRMEGSPGALGRRGRKGIDPLRALISLKIAALVGIGSFPLAARQAAVRELREKR